MRGRLINAYMVVIAQLDAQLSAATQPGYDPVFQEPAVRINPVTHQRESGRKERTVRLPAQIDPESYGALVVLANGIAPRTGTTLTFHYEEFEERGMLDLERRVTPIRVTDRLVAIHSLEDDELLVTFPNPPGCFCEEARPDSFMGGRANLLVTRWKDRPQGRPAGG